MTSRVFVLLIATLAGIAQADELTMMVEKDLAALGYATGAVDGEETMETVIAISKFQAENQMEVTGEVTPQLAGILSAHVENPDLTREPAVAAAAVPQSAPEPADDAAALQAAQQACLEEKMRNEQERQARKRGLSRLMSAASRTASQQGNYDVAQRMNEVSQANATFDDLAAAAKDFGLSNKQIDKCKNPG
ncbi:MAG: peptidoglycan-binding protein [Gammaproteobacteria bacterium]|nr:peptidoglycan-binding protein [Gammaproteobacteria bacterium]